MFQDFKGSVDIGEIEPCPVSGSRLSCDCFVITRAFFSFSFPSFSDLNCCFLGMGLNLGVSVCHFYPPPSCAQLMFFMFFMSNVQPTIIGSAPRCLRSLCASQLFYLRKMYIFFFCLLSSCRQLPGNLQKTPQPPTYSASCALHFFLAALTLRGMERKPTSHINLSASAVT